MLSPAFTACPAEATILRTLPGTEAVTLTAPAPAAGAAALGAAAGAAFGAATGAAAGALTASCFFYSNFICCSIYGDCIAFHF